MSVRLYDISRTLFASMAVWPGDTSFELRPTGSIAKGDIVNVTTLTLSAHTGTHVDAPYHFTDEGQTMEQVDLAVYWGLAQVVTVKRESGPLVPSDFAGYDLGRAPRLLVKSGASAADPRLFHTEFVHPGPELADYLGTLGIVLYGADGPSMDEPNSKTLPGHHALQRNHILILEGLDLTDVPDGLYELAAFPLRILGGDGSPVRAVLRSIADEQ
ncbi:MAG: cyclase family protein [Anaerolineales bacterium]|uniref:cyclase family protein n=1 Tax=Promineifilum sp. TaxID=2664178 RepID=UPI001D23A9F1|nr:cyclase family protein [Anaerolineales bacterium]MCO5180036.1 cyclase family protein [Promineifilum sp.]